MALTQQQLADLTAWVDQYAAQTDQLVDEAARVVAAAYAGASFYNAAAVAAAAEQAADASNTAALLAAGLAAQYLAMTTSQILGSAVGVPNLPLPPIRNGVDMRQVFERPAKFFRRQVAKGVPTDKALEQSMRLAASLADGNVRLAERDASSQVLRYLAPGIDLRGYRRVIRPELSRTGTCGLCIVASDQVYSTPVLMPLHDRCKCVVLPIIGDDDPGSALNNLTLGDFYAAAADSADDLRRSGSRRGGPRRRSGTAGEDLKEIRVQVNEHGEWGPVLTNADHNFTGAQDLEGYDPNTGQRRPQLALAPQPGGGSSGGGGGDGEDPPRRGLLGPDTPDEFPSFDGWQPPAARSEIDAFTVDQAEVLLDGDGTPGGHGYHRAGLGVKSNEFPFGWDVAEVVAWVLGITDQPTFGHPTPSGFALYGSFADVEGIVRIRREIGIGWVIATAYPLPAIQWPR